MRHCPTLEGDDRPLIAHTIGPGLCLSRQRTFYHKCHRCRYRGKPAEFSLHDVGPPSPNGAAPPVLIEGLAPARAAAERLGPQRSSREAGEGNRSPVG